MLKHLRKPLIMLGIPLLAPCTSECNPSRQVTIIDSSSFYPLLSFLEMTETRVTDSSIAACGQLANHFVVLNARHGFIVPFHRPGELIQFGPIDLKSPLATCRRRLEEFSHRTLRDYG